MKHIKWVLSILGMMLFCVVLSLGVGCQDATDPNPDEDDNKVHVHTFEKEWTMTEDAHWHKSTCEHTKETSEMGDHTFDQGVVVTPAGCEEDGTVRFTCTVCGFYYEETSPAKGHSFGFYEETLPRSCEREGIETRTCARCGLKETRDIPMSNHVPEGAWSFSDTEHWRACLCGNETEVGEHTYEGGICTVCSMKEGDVATNELAFLLSSDGSYYIVTGRGTLREENLKNPMIPSTYKGLPVEEIAEGAFLNVGELQTLILPASIRVIGENAFYACNSLEVVSISGQIEYIGTGAFAGCTNVVRMTIEGSSSRYRMESGCLIENDTSTLLYAMGGATIPSDIRVIGEKAFFGCSSMKRITIPDGVEIIHDWAFFDCSSLEEVILPDSVTFVGEYAFSGCASVTNIRLSSAMTALSDHVFEGCTSLVVLLIPDGVKDIGTSAFYGCVALKTIHIPDATETIGTSPFGGCISLEKITVGENNPHYYAEANCLIYQKNGAGRKTVVAGCKTSQIPFGVHVIGTGAFFGHEGLAIVNIPDTVDRIGATAFAGCTGIVTLRFGSGLVTIGDRAFADCSSLKEVFIPAHVNNLGSHVFDGCMGIGVIRCEVKYRPETWNKAWADGCDAVVRFGQTAQ